MGSRLLQLYSSPLTVFLNAASVTPVWVISNAAQNRRSSYVSEKMAWIKR